MLRCSKKAYAQCPDRHLCGPIEDATFTEDSECAAFNRAVEDVPMTNADSIRDMSEWISVNDRLPENGVVVHTKIHDEKGVRNVTKLMRRGKLWFLTDKSMYVYYTPTHWKPLA